MAVRPTGRHPLNNQPDTKPQQVQGRDVQTRNGQTGVVGRGGNFQPLGAAAQRGLQSGQPSSAPVPAPAPSPVAQPETRTPPMWDPATLKPGAGRNPVTGGVLTLPGGPGAVDYAGPGGGGWPGIASMLGEQAGQAGPPGMFGNPNQQLGVQAPGSDAGNIDNAISSLRSQLGISGAPAGAGAGNIGNGASGGAGNVLNVRPPSPLPYSFGASPGIVPTGAGPNFGKPLPNNGAAGIATQPQQPNPYAALLRSRLGGGGGANVGNAARAAVGGAMGGLRGY